MGLYPYITGEPLLSPDYSSVRIQTALLFQPLPHIFGTPSRIRAYNLQFRRLMLYPIELWVQGLVGGWEN